MGDADLKVVQPASLPVQVIDWYGESVPFSPPLNPHAGCFFLTRPQLHKWVSSANWQDGDVSFISPLESAATLGISKNFKLYKTAYSHSAWLQLQHYGQSFHSLIATAEPKS